MTMAMLARNNRVRSSRMCSMSVIEPSEARWKLVGWRRPRSLTLVVRLVLAGPLYRVQRRGHVVRDQRSPTGRRLRLAGHVVIGQATGLGLEDAQRTAQPAGRVGQALRTEQQNEQHGQHDD